MAERCGFVDGWLQCDLTSGHAGLHEDHWVGGKPTAVGELFGAMKERNPILEEQ